MKLKDVVEVMYAHAVTGIVVRHIATNEFRIWSDAPQFVDTLFHSIPNVDARKFTNEIKSNGIALKCKHVAACYRPPRYETVAILSFRI